MMVVGGNNMKQAPEWVTKLIEHVVKEHSHRALPKLIWRKRSGFHSSGTTYTGFNKKIIVRYGSDELDQRLVLLHELAHWISPKNSGHTVRFWKTAWMLYDIYGIPEKYAVDREKHYKKRAIITYIDMKVTNQIWKGGEQI